MADLDLLLAAIHASPDDVGSRMVYADLLLERGDPLGELIHVDCTIATLPLYDPGRRPLFRRRTEIFDAHLRDGLLDWWQWEGKFPRFSNGFIEGLHFTSRAAVDMFANLDEQLAEMYDQWANRRCRCGAQHDPLMWVTPKRTFPLIRRFGGLPFGAIEAIAPALDERGALEVRVIGNGDWRWLAAIHSLETVVISTNDAVKDFEHAIALPRLVELVFDRSPKLVLRLAEIGIPRSVRVISVEPMHAQPLRDALIASGRTFVENERPSGDELILVTDVKRPHDLAFIDRPIISDDALVPYPIEPGLRSLYERKLRPTPDWPMRGEIPMVIGHPQVAFGSRGTPEPVEHGIRIASCGPIYVRLDHLAANRPILVIWRISRVVRSIQVQAGSEYIDAPLPPVLDRGTNWVFVIPASVVRNASSLQLIIAGYRNEPFTVFGLRYFQPDD